MSTASMVVCASHSPLIDSTDGGVAGTEFLAAVESAKERIRAFAPDLVVFFGPDHSRALANLVPAVTVVTSATGYGDWGTPTDTYDVDEAVAHQVASAMLARNFDVAVGSDIRLDHGFGQTFGQLFGNLGAIPCLPIVLNCARPPLAPVQRIIDVGAAVGSCMADLGRRILWVGSGGLSHQPPSMSKAVTALSEEEREAVSRRTILDAAKHINPVWDKRFLASLTSSDWSTLRRIADEELDAVGYGTHEIRTWLAAWSASGATAGSYSYGPVPEWITGMGVAVGA
jgi:2,3-dihydroxyphenylpropionate 1,2-dioxygenase